MQELCGCHWSHSRDTNVVLSITSMRKQRRAGRKGENDSFSGECPVLGQRLRLLFLLKCHGLRTCKPFIFYFWCSCPVRLFSTTFFPLPTIVKLSSLLLPCSRVFPHYLHPGSPQSMEHSHHEVVTFNYRNYSFCERATLEGINIQNSLWDNFRCWDTSEEGKVEWLLYIWMRCQLTTTGLRKGTSKWDGISGPDKSNFWERKVIRRYFSLYVDKKDYLNTVLESENMGGV